MSERSQILLGAAGSVLGILTSLWFSETVGALLTIGGVLCGLYGLHRFGRSGSDVWTPPSTRS